MRLKLHDRLVDGYAKLQVCLCLLPLRKDLIRASIRGCKSFVEVVKLVDSRRRHRGLGPGGWRGEMIVRAGLENWRTSSATSNAGTTTVSAQQRREDCERKRKRNRARCGQLGTYLFFATCTSYQGKVERSGEREKEVDLDDGAEGEERGGWVEEGR